MQILESDCLNFTCNTIIEWGFTLGYSGGEAQPRP